MEDVAKRMRDTGTYEDPFVRRLSSAHKHLWFYILDKCDHAGVWKEDLDLAEFFTGCKLDRTEALDALGEKVQLLQGGLWFIPSFIKFQYGLLDESNRVHRSVLAVLESRGLEAPMKSLDSPLQGAKVKDKDKDKAKAKVKELDLTEFQQFYKAFPRKKAVGEAEKAWNQMKPPLAGVLASLEWQRKQEDWLKDGGKWAPYPATYLRARSWEDEMPGWAAKDHAPARQAHVHKFNTATVLNENEDRTKVLVACVLPNCNHREWVDSEGHK